MVLDRLEAADRHAELAPLLDVGGAQRQQRARQADQLRRRPQHAAVPRGQELLAIDRERLAGEQVDRLHAAEPAGAVDRVDRGRGRGVEQPRPGVLPARLAVAEQQHVGDAGERHEPGAVERRRDEQLAGEQPLEALPPARRREQRRRDERALHERQRQRDAPGLLEQRHDVARVEAEAAALLGHGRAEHAHLGELPPHAQRAVRLLLDARPSRADDRRRALALEQLAQRRRAAPPARRSGRSASSAHFRGRPSTRSATMLRWISFVPA